MLRNIAAVSLALTLNIQGDVVEVVAGDDVLPCGPVAMALVFKLLDQPVYDFELAQLADANGETSFAQLYHFAIDRGLCVQAVRFSPDELSSLSSPAILHVALPGT